MAKRDLTLWRDLIGYLRENHAGICRQWFEDLSPAAFDGGLLQIRTHTSVQQAYLQKKCLDQFTEAAQAVTGKLVAVRFVNGTPSAPPATNGPSGPSPATGEPQPAPPSAAPAPPTGASRRHIVQSHGHDGDEPLVLSPDYCFENFITGPNNQFACAAAVAVANQPGAAYNPLFIHGGVGLGKTHLLQAICQHLLTADPETRILYVSCDAFMNQFITCVGSGKMSEFRHRYRHVGVLVIDDIHFLANRGQTQEEFFHTFNELYQSNRQIVLSSDAPPAEIPDLEERLISRFQWGLVTPVTKPTYETRVAILRAKAQLYGVTIPDEVISLIAGRVDSNARDLEGKIKTLIGRSRAFKRPIDLELAREDLGETTTPPRSNQATLQSIINTVTGFYNVKLSDLQSRRRHKSVTEPRQVCMHLAREMTRFSLEEIGGYFGGRDHTTVMHSVRTIDARKDNDPAFDREIQQLKAEVKRQLDQPGG